MVLPFTSYCVLNANTPPSIHRSGYIPFRWYEPLSGDGDGGDDGVAVNAHHLLFYIYMLTICLVTRMGKNSIGSMVHLVETFHFTRTNKSTCVSHLKQTTIYSKTMFQFNKL